MPLVLQGAVNTYVDPGDAAFMLLWVASSDPLWFMRPASPSLAPLVPGKEAHSLWVGVDRGEVFPGTLQFQVSKVMPVSRGGQQTLQCLQ